MSGRSAHVRRFSNDGRRRSSSHGDATPRIPAPHGLLHPDDIPPLPTVAVSHSPSSSALPSSSTSGTTLAPSAPEHAGLKRLGFLGDMLQLSSAGLLAASTSHPPSAASSATQRSATTPIPSSLLPARSHSRLDSARDGAHSPAPSMAAPASQANKGHISPSKTSSTRTYEHKLVSREMHRLGTLAHLPSLAPSLSAATAQSALVGMAPASAPNISAALNGEAPWQSLNVLVLPLFNSEPLRCPIEDLNQLVRKHISAVVSAAPGKAVATLENDTYDLIAAGMVTLNSRLLGVDDDKLIPRVVDLWHFFWTQVLPYLEGSLLPLQTDPILSSLYRLPKSHRPSSPTSTQNGKGAGPSSSAQQPIDVRALALVSFRDRVILPLFSKLHTRLTTSKDESASAPGPDGQHARLHHMLLVLVSQRSQRLAPLSLTAAPPQPTQGEAAITRLLRALHAPLASAAGRQRTATGGASTLVGAGGAPSFLSAGLPRDRRGRIAQKAEVGFAHAHAHAHAHGSASVERRGAGAGGAAGAGRHRWRSMEAEYEDGRDGSGAYSWEGDGRIAGAGVWGTRRGGRRSWDEAGADTPRVGATFADPARERDQELLESLRSPDPEDSARMRMRGWGLRPASRQDGADEDGFEGDEEAEAEDEEEHGYGPYSAHVHEDMDWDEAQAVLEHMVGLRNEENAAGGRRAQVIHEGYM